MAEVTENSTRQPEPPRAGGRGFPLFRIFGIQIRIDWSWLIIFFLMIFLLREDFARALKGAPEWTEWALSAVSVIALFACVLAHELGHSLVAMRHGIQMFDITLFVFGGMARLRGEPRTPGDELKIALAGPAVTVVLGVIFWAAWLGVRPADYQTASLWVLLLSEGLRYLAFINTALLVFNMIPGFPLDGGRVLRAILWKARGNLLTATQTAAAVGKGFGGLLILGGLMGMLWLGGGFWITGLFWVFIGWFLMGAANESVRYVQLRDMLGHFRVIDAMQANVVTVGPELTLERLVSEVFYRYHFKCFPVVEGGRLVGLIGTQNVQRVPPERWGEVTVAEAMAPASAAVTIRPEEGLFEAFRRMSEDDMGRLIVVNEADAVVGLLSRRDIMNLLRVYTELHPANVRPGPLPPTFRKAIPVDEHGHPIEERPGQPPPTTGSGPANQAMSQERVREQ